MNLTGGEQMNVENVKVISLFKKMDTIESTLDPIAELIEEMGVEEVSETKVEMKRNVATENHFPDQSLFILDEQMKLLKKRLNRMKFYIGELDDLLPN
jgi:hypothetical protein